MRDGVTHGCFFWDLTINSLAAQQLGKLGARPYKMIKFLSPLSALDRLCDFCL